MGLSLRGQTSGAVDINAPAVAGDNTITLPGGNGSANQFYKNSDTAGIITHSSMTESSSGVISIGDIDIDGTTRTITTGVGQTVGFSTDIEVQGSVSISSGNLVLASGNGIDFSANANVTGMTSELLDDYEEGTWTPTITDLSLGNGSITGHYTKTGNIVHVSFSLNGGSTTTFTSTMTGIFGLPFTNALAGNSGLLTASNLSNNWLGYTQQYSTGSGTNYIQWVTSSNVQAIGSGSIPFTWGANTKMRFNMTYRAA